MTSIDPRARRIRPSCRPCRSISSFFRATESEDGEKPYQQSMVSLSFELRMLVTSDSDVANATRRRTASRPPRSSAQWGHSPPKMASSARPPDPYTPSLPYRIRFTNLIKYLLTLIQQLGAPDWHRVGGGLRWHSDDGGSRARRHREQSGRGPTRCRHLYLLKFGLSASPGVPVIR